MARYCYWDEIAGEYVCEGEDDGPTYSVGPIPDYDPFPSDYYDPKYSSPAQGYEGPGYDAGNEFDLGSLLKKAGNSVLGLGGKALDFATSDKGILALLLAGLASGDRRPAYGGGTRMAMPVAPVPQRMAAQGGLMQAYRQGGSVRPFPMQDGGFVMTKRAVDGAGGPRGIGALLPAVRPIRGPGTGTSDSIPATIRGRNGVTPAKVSNGEAYVPPQAVRQAGGAQQMYALMNRLQRRA
jgi:hypothetical protein